MKIVKKRVQMYERMKEKKIQIKEVIEKWGVKKEKMIEMKQMKGERKENVKGIKGIGKKKEEKLMEEFGDIEKILEREYEIKKKKRREKIMDFEEKKKIERELVKIKKDVKIDIDMEGMVMEKKKGKKMIGLMKEMELKQIKRRVEEEKDKEDYQVEK